MLQPRRALGSKELPMFSLLFLALLYFLPAIIGRNKTDATGIFLLNLLLGWTLVGWVVDFLWACASDRPTYVHYATIGASPFCSRPGIVGARPRTLLQRLR